MDNDLEGMWKEAFVAWSREVVRNVYGGSDENHEARPVSEPVSSRGSKPASPKYKWKALRFGKASSVSGTSWEQEKKQETMKPYEKNKKG